MTAGFFGSIMHVMVERSLVFKVSSSATAQQRPCNLVALIFDKVGRRVLGLH